MRSSTWTAFSYMLQKELCVGFRARTRWMLILMFAITTLACLSLAVGGVGLTPRLQAALLWILIFFAALTGTGQTFTDEEQQGTLLVLRAYGPAQAVLFGKMAYMLLELAALALVIVPLACLFLDILPVQLAAFALAIVLGVGGIAAAGTLVAFLTLSARVRGGLFFVLMLPLMLPVLLPGIAVTAAAIAGSFTSVSWLGGLALYDAVLAAASSVLFDYVWYDT